MLVSLCGPRELRGTLLLEIAMLRHRLLSTVLAISMAATTLGGGGFAAAQTQGPGPGPGEAGPPPPSQYGSAPPPPDQGPPPPPGQYNVPPPPGYQSGADPYDTSPQARAEDDRYSYEAERWAAANCVSQRANNTVGGAVIGGLLGALVGAAAGGRYDRGGRAVAGGALGAVAGAAIGGSPANNPNCPPGYVLRAGAPPFYPPVYGEVIYAAPGWYDPWLWYGGHWIYRPYPYHRYWYRAHPYRR